MSWRRLVFSALIIAPGIVLALLVAGHWNVAKITNLDEVDEFICHIVNGPTAGSDVRVDVTNKKVFYADGEAGWKPVIFRQTGSDPFQVEVVREGVGRMVVSLTIREE